MARHAAEEGENMVDEEVMEVEDMRRKRREADPVVIPTNANVLAKFELSVLVAADNANVDKFSWVVDVQLATIAP